MAKKEKASKADVAKALKKLRLLLETNIQRKVAEMVGISQAHLSEVMSGKTPPGKDLVEAILEGRKRPPVRTVFSTSPTPRPKGEKVLRLGKAAQNRISVQNKTRAAVGLPLLKVTTKKCLNCQRSFETTGGGLCRGCKHDSFAVLTGMEVKE